MPVKTNEAFESKEEALFGNFYILFQRLLAIGSSLKFLPMESNTNDMDTRHAITSIEQ